MNTKIDTNIGGLKAEAYRSINQTFSPLSSNNSHSYFNQPSADINQWPLSSRHILIHVLNVLPNTYHP